MTQQAAGVVAHVVHGMDAITDPSDEDVAALNFVAAQLAGAGDAVEVATTVRLPQSSPSRNRWGK